MTDLASKLGFYELGAAIDPPRVATMEGLAQWHDHLADYFDGGIQVEGANLAVTPTGKRAVRNQYRKLIAHYVVERDWHRGAAVMIRRTMLRPGCQ